MRRMKWLWAITQGTADAGVEVDGFLAGGGLDRLGDFLQAFPLVFDGDRAEAGEGAVAGLELAEDRLGVGFLVAVLEGFHVAGQVIRDHPIPREREGFVEDGHHSDHGTEAEWNHKWSAAGEKQPDGLE
jgi:hypothetical protein